MTRGHVTGFGTKNALPRLHPANRVQRQFCIHTEIEKHPCSSHEISLFGRAGSLTEIGIDEMRESGGISFRQDMKRFRMEDRRGHRSETRRRGEMLKVEIAKVKKYFA